MRFASIVVIVAVCIVGCKPADDANNASGNPTNNTPATAAHTPANRGAGSGGSGGVTPMASGAAGGMTPMSGTDSVEGAGGGGVAQAAKQSAKKNAAKMSNGSLDQAGKEDAGQ